MPKYQVWDCRIIVASDELPEGFDSVPRSAVKEAIHAAGFEVLLCSTGWGGKPSQEDMEYLDRESTPDKLTESTCTCVGGGGDGRAYYGAGSVDAVQRGGGSTETFDSHAVRRGGGGCGSPPIAAVAKEDE